MVADAFFSFASFVFLWTFLAWIACGIFAAYVAAQKNRCVPCWFVWGVLFGPIALISIVGVPIRSRQSVEPVIGPDGKLMT